MLPLRGMGLATNYIIVLLPGQIRAMAMAACYPVSMGASTRVPSYQD
jgi:hypothetical protein